MLGKKNLHKLISMLLIVCVLPFCNIALNVPALIVSVSLLNGWNITIRGRFITHITYTHLSSRRLVFSL